MLKDLFYLLAIFICANNIYAHDLDSQIEQLGEELINTNIHPEKSFAQYVDDLIVILKQKPNSDSFCSKLDKIKHSKNGVLVGLTFLQHKKFFSPAIIKRAASMDSKKLTEIFYRRTHPAACGK